MTERWKRRARLVGLGSLGIALVLAGIALVAYGRLRASLPKLSGELRIEGLAAPVTIERDELGVPTVHGSDRLDVARATGFLHAQDRFFQMDLLRRRSAGELAGLIGPALTERDRAIRVHRFRALARRSVERADPPTRTLLEAYASGVNAGLRALGAAPFEYLLLRSRPRDWVPEDTLLVVFAMYVDLQDETGARESHLGVIRDVLGAEWLARLAPWTDPWDAPLDAEPPALPERSAPPAPPDPGAVGPSPVRAGAEAGRAEGFAGSNAWVVSGRLAVGDAALLANDMHLPLRLPSTWYRASLVWPDGRGGLHRVTGVTLPGTPTTIAGSNGRVAWGFTNAYGDFADLVELEPGDGEDAYRTPAGERTFDRHVERIEVRGEPDRTVDVRWTIWGPVIDADHRGLERALRWVAHDDGAVNFGLLEMETARDVDEAIDVATRTAIPAQNVVVADRSGRIGWTVSGRIPRRVGFDGRTPTSWADGSRGWRGYLDPGTHPRIVDPPSGRLWSANNRAVGGDAMRRLGDGGYALGARARQIRDALRSIDRAGPRDLLAIQLDDRAIFLERWRALLLETLARIEPDPRRDELRRLVEGGWTGRASTDSAAYRMVRTFRDFVAERVLVPLTAPCASADARFRPTTLRRWEGAVWHRVADGADAADVLEVAVDDLLRAASHGDAPLDRRTWGERNTLVLRHPLSAAVPWLSRWLDLPPTPLPGDRHMPRVQTPRFGASQRMVVAPGDETGGLFHMPGGQSGHPLSPYYARGHEAWTHGEPTPFLPGPTAHRLVLVP